VKWWSATQLLAKWLKLLPTSFHYSRFSIWFIVIGDIYPSASTELNISTRNTRLLCVDVQLFGSRVTSSDNAQMLSSAVLVSTAILIQWLSKTQIIERSKWRLLLWGRKLCIAGRVALYLCANHAIALTGSGTPAVKSLAQLETMRLFNSSGAVLHLSSCRPGPCCGVCFFYTDQDRVTCKSIHTFRLYNLDFGLWILRHMLEQNYGAMEITSVVVIGTSCLLELAYPSMLHAKSKIVELTTNGREITSSGQLRTKALFVTISTAEHKHSRVQKTFYAYFWSNCSDRSYEHFHMTTCIW